MEAGRWKDQVATLKNVQGASTNVVLEYALADLLTQSAYESQMRRLSASTQPQAAKADKVALASFKQYREKDGQFYFKLAAADGEVLLQSKAFDSGKVAGQTIAQLQRDGAAALAALTEVLEPMDTAAHTAASAALVALAEAAALAAQEKAAKA